MIEPAFERFPVDGVLYRLVWAGRVTPPGPSIATARVKLWFVRIDETDTECLRFASRPGGELSTLVLEEAAGSIPKLVLGSFWRDRTLQTGYRMPDEMTVRGATLLHQAWQTVRCHHPAGGSNRPWLAPDEYPLAGRDASDTHLRFHDAPLLRCFTESGLELLIPCYEVFRRFYAMTSELANALLSGYWGRELKTLIDPEATGVTEDGESFEVAPAVDMRDIGCSAIAYFMMVESAGARASEIFLALENARRADIVDPWIVARPPWNDQVMSLSFVGQQLRSGAVLVLWIYSSAFPRLPLPVVRVEREMQVMVEDPEAQPRAPGAKLEDRLGELEDSTIQRATDARVSRAAVHFGLGEWWTQLPRLRRRARAKRYIPVNRENTPESPPPRQRQLTTGKRAQAGRVASASLSSDTQNTILDRFHALAECFEEMLQAGELRSREDYALVRPVSVGDVTYCAFPTSIGDADRPWSVVNPLEPRPRLCWVSELTDAKGQIYYWIEVEAVQREAFKALLLKPRVPGAQLTADTLETVLKVGTIDKGQWKKSALLTIEEEVSWLSARHSFASGRLRRSVVLGKINSIR